MSLWVVWFGSSLWVVIMFVVMLQYVCSTELKTQTNARLGFRQVQRNAGDLLQSPSWTEI